MWKSDKGNNMNMDTVIILYKEWQAVSQLDTSAFYKHTIPKMTIFRFWYVSCKQQFPLGVTELGLIPNVAFSDKDMWNTPS